jgi:phenylacetic acid degradation operon negative regulatory protein
MKFFHKANKAMGLIFEVIDGIAEVSGINYLMSADFPISRRAMGRAAHGWGKSDYYVALKTLKRRGYIKKSGNDYFITPKAFICYQMSNIEKSNWTQKKWDGTWKIVIFDVPEDRRGDRDAFRSFLKRKGFYKLQQSVFVSPFADFEQLNFARHQYGLEKYVNLFVAKSAGTDDDSKLKTYFSLV